MKIIQLIQKPQRRGAEIFAAQLSEAMRLSGHEVLLVSIFEGDSDLPFNDEMIKLNRPINNRFFDFKGWNDFAKIVKRFNPEFIQANAADTLKFSVFSKILFRWKTPIIYRNANQMGDFIRNGLHLSFNQWLLNQVSGVVSVSKASKDNLHKTFRLSVEKSIVIPIGIDKKHIELSLKEAPHSSLPESYLIQIGGLVQEKDPIGMLEIFEQNAKNNPELHLVYVGSGPLEASLREAIKVRNLGQIVHLIPNQLNIFPILSRAKAMAMPSKIEGLPAVILEAMYCKIPIVAYAVGGIGEIIQTDKTGWLVEKGDKAGFGKAINQVLEMPSAQLTLITDYGKKMVLEKYTLEKVANQFEAFYKNLPAKARDQTNNF